ncbi:MAG: hypothetical protein A3F70_11420 [Acidobacteria bacterium RIFCSPLOWO2_12_FULL_67_14]|nr:MAG: hypothetical protein A3H29_16070 [Acidobacteria bacterium RIFCSPLOWO2_02_FULL_67_21]OFW39243.1 MAG: hypothetical protein A3F70_11420 [Acidobacteria bacterium RIFCSPLOWO2_12_FULL_67_14]
MIGRLSESMLLLLVGAALGPAGLGVLSADVLSFLDPAMPVALVALGLLAGLGVAVRPAGERRLLAAASIEALITTVIVAAGMLLVISAWNGPADVPYWFFALVVGVCAAPSSVAAPRHDDPRTAAERIGTLDGLLPIAVGAAALALLREQSGAAAIITLFESAGVTLVIVLAGWLLISRSASETEQRVFTAALLLLLGGAADYLALSALLSGLLAGLLLEGIGGRARDSVRRDVLHFQHPLLVLVLIVTGARVELPPVWIGLGLVYILLRTGAKLAAGWVARRIGGSAVPADLGMRLLSPGVLGIAFALNVLRASGPDAAGILAVAAVGTLGSDMISALVSRREEAA